MTFQCNCFGKPSIGTKSWSVTNKWVLQMHFPDIYHGGILQRNKLSETLK